MALSVMIVYITAADPAEAERIGRTCVSERLAACANLIPGLRSIYWWDGAVQDAAEAALLLKTTAARLPALIARVRALHSYDCPCVEAWPVADGDPDFLAWVVRETGG